MRGILRKPLACGGLLGLILVGTAAVSAPAKPPAPPWSPVEVSVFEEGDGYKFANVAGVPFFTNDRDKDGKVGCGDECIGITWLPVFARGFAKPMGDWSIVIRPDKTTQWAYKGKPVYDHFAPAPHDEILALAKEDGHWHVLVP
jgi:predicted lipoprotein with Yx(FWY)xxD motif